MENPIYFVSYMCEVISRPDGKITYWPRCVLVNVHPFVWFAQRVEAGAGGVIILSWQKLTAEEVALNTQVIKSWEVR